MYAEKTDYDDIEMSSRLRNILRRNGFKSLEGLREYPKDNTPGCTKQACGFSERHSQFTEKGAVILGVSKDSVASHKRFEEKYGLAFTLLADPERKVIESYDVWKEKKNYGKVSMGVVRTTYLIDEQGIIIKANDKVKAADDPENMLKELA